MKWLEEYQYHEVCLVGDDELTIGRSRLIQILYEFDITSTSLPDIKDPNMTPEYISKSSSLSFDIPSCPINKRLKGINVTFMYTLSGEYWAWFCKINTTNGVDLMYNPKVFGKPESGELCIWLSYWPIGNALNNNMEWEEVLGKYLDEFELSTGAYYLCRRDFFEQMEVGRLTPDWFRILVEVRGWRKTGRPKQVNNPSFTELKTVRCIIHGPQIPLQTQEFGVEPLVHDVNLDSFSKSLSFANLGLVFMIKKQEDIYNIAEMSKSSLGYKTVASTSSLLEGGMKSGTKSDPYLHVSLIFFFNQKASGYTV
ncbi:hypothetical protein Hanom_Chr09g00775511 [Helianthus anomalus]